MLDKLEIYPYQRVSDNCIPKKSKRISRKIKPQLKVNLSPSLHIDIMAILRAVMTVENLLLVLGMVIFSRAFVLGELLPFIFAGIAAFGYGDRGRLILLPAAAVLGFLTVLNGFNLWSGIITAAVLAGVFGYVSIDRDKQWWGLPLLTVSVLIVAKSLLLFIDGFSFYREMNVIFEAMISGILTFVFMVGSDAIKQKKPLVEFNFEDIAAFVVMGIGIIMGLTGITIGGLGIASILCRLGILIAAFLWGSAGGTMVGVMAGIIPSIASSVFAQTLGMYAISGLLAGAFRNFGRIGVIIGFMLGTLALTMFTSETQVAILGIWETGIACMAFFLLPYSLKEKLPVQILGPLSSFKKPEEQQTDSNLKEAAKNRIEHLANVFDELSSTFTVTEKDSAHSSDTAYLNYLYDEVSHGFCEQCSRYKRCWEEECYNTSQIILDLFTLAESNGTITYDECSPEFKNRCLYARELISAVNYLFNNLRTNEYWYQKLNESRDLVATQLKGLGQVVRNLAQELDVKTVVDFALRDKLLKQVKHLDIRDITPIRTNGEQLHLNVVSNCCSDGQTCATLVAPAISSLMGEKMEVGQKKCPRLRGKGTCEFSLTRAFTYRVITGMAQAGPEEICGDSYTISTLAEGKELVAVSDGMGVGENAYAESQAAIGLLENLLNSGFDKEVALKTINSVLFLKSTEETFATVDMVLIDLYTAEVDFIKVGCAPTFVKRGKKVGVVTSNSLPIGIMDELDMVSEKRSLCPRDMLVMVSDGVLENPRQDSDDWLTSFLAKVDESDPQVLAEMILNRSLSLTKGKPRDDMTVICMYIDLNFPH
ncbi:MAG: stage II sporulation protein E [Syntrophomonadaceae bacterium]|jgi:stage II sporulation protein E